MPYLNEGKKTYRSGDGVKSQSSEQVKMPPPVKIPPPAVSKGQ